MKKITVGWCICALVDDEDYEYLSQWKWRLSEQGYAVRTEPGTNSNEKILMHRIVLGRKLGHDNFECTHHINWNTLDNWRKIFVKQRIVKTITIEANVKIILQVT